MPEDYPTGNVTFTNVRIFDGTGEYPYTGEVVVQGNRIRSVTRGGARMPSIGGGSIGGGTVIDGMGATLMPGLCDAHLHLSWQHCTDLDRPKTDVVHDLLHIDSLSPPPMQVYHLRPGKVLYLL